MAIRSKNRVQTNFNMSSMTDIVFLLLIFFIIASTLISPSSVDVNLPNANPISKPQSHTVTVTVSKDLKYYVNENEVSEQSIEAKLLELMGDSDESSIILRSDETVPMKYVVTIMGIANRNKFKLVIATSPN